MPAFLSDHLLRRFWYQQTIRAQLIVAIGAISICAGFAAGTISILNARKATRIEVESSLELAKHFVLAIVADLDPAGGDLSKKIDQLSQRLRLSHLRHVRIFLADAAGKLMQVSQQGEKVRPDAPPWFAALIAPEVAPQSLSVVAADQRGGAVIIVEEPFDVATKIWSLGTIVIAGAPEDEIAEVWEDVSSLALVWLLLGVLMLAVLYLALGRMLEPLRKLALGMSSLEDGQYATRLNAPKVKELAVIANRFNLLAGALATARSENSVLYGKLIDVQEMERRELANELHDEASPCLFGIAANAMSAKLIASKRSDPMSVEICGHMTEILSVAQRLTVLNRALLKKLRPAALGHVKFEELIDDLILELKRRHPDVRLSHSITTERNSYGEAMDLTIFRCVQEGITNAIRHGKSRNVLVELQEKGSSRRTNGSEQNSVLRLSIEDDGSGIPFGAANGFGVTVMRERVRALGGEFDLQNNSPHGVKLNIVVPIGASPQESITKVTHVNL